MHRILDRVAGLHGRFLPQTATEYLALQLARRLGDLAAVRQHAELATRHPQERLLLAYRKAVQTSDPAGRFRAELDRSNGNGAGLPRVWLGGFRVERRSIAAVIFEGERLDYTQVRQLSSLPERAEASAAGFVSWLLQHFPFQSVAVERVSQGTEIQRSVLTKRIVEMLRSQGVSIWEVSKQQLFEAYGHPAVRSRKELRAIIGSIWPIINNGYGKPFIQDAAALGLYVQIERLFL